MNKIARSILAFCIGIVVMFASLILASFLYKSIYDNNTLTNKLSIMQIVFMVITYAFTSFFSCYAVARFKANDFAKWLPISFLTILTILMFYALFMMPTPGLQLFIYIMAIATSGFFAIKIGSQFSIQK
jgi:Na+/proline symporter